MLITVSCSNHQIERRPAKEAEFEVATIDNDTAQRLKNYLESLGWVVQFNGEYMDTYCSRRCAQ